MIEADPVVSGILAANGLDQYIDIFKYHRIRSDILGELTMQDLCDAGVKSIGHRLKLYKLIGAPPKEEIVETEQHSYTTLELETRIMQTERQIMHLCEDVDKLKQELHIQVKHSTANSSASSSMKSPGVSPSQTMSHFFKAKYTDVDRKSIYVFSLLEPFKRITSNDEDTALDFIDKVCGKYQLNSKLKYRLLIVYGNMEQEVTDSPILIYRKLTDEGHNPVFLIRGSFF